MTTPLVLIAGGSSAAGIAVANELLGTGMRVLTVGSDAGRISAAAQLTAGAVPLVCDLADPAAVAELAASVHTDFGPVDGLIHLVGGWRGGADLAAQSDTDWDVLHASVLRTLRNTSKAFFADLATSPVGRLAIVSSSSVTAPTAGNANYAAIKAAAETWVQAVAQGFEAEAATGGTPIASAAVVLVVKALVDDSMRARSPERKFPGFTDVGLLGRTVAELFSTDASELNGARIILN
ncbi:SDR family NAD(P)-dependent oxidoreductase [Arthrobacter glacialis]|uniref:Oxidoreductase n=1 Tax=Arthrobacter glacialis TaxID=1664 RepID=A0A2S3ZVE3_ARTGL|nr:SDR family oxidoreductase [Arthrobacter glacialis]POH73225.1 oxidoreductase [Arthrobacter glacialis]